MSLFLTKKKDNSNFVVAYLVEREVNEKSGTRLTYKYVLKQKIVVLTV